MGVPLPWRSLLATLASLGFHLALGLWLMVHSSRLVRAPAPPVPDVWSGSAVEVDSIGTEQQSGAAPADQATGPSPAGEDGEPSVEPPAPASPSRVEAPEPPADRPSRVRAAAPPSTAALGERDESKPDKRELSPVEAALAAGEATFRGARGESDEDRAAPAATAAPASFGAEGLPPGVRHLPKAFTRALHQGGWRDREWQQLPLGSAGELVIELVVDEQGKLADLVYVDPKAAQRQPAPLRRMVERCVMMLRAGTYSLLPSTRESGKQRLKVEATLSQVEAGRETYGNDPPAPGRPGRSYFVLTSGLRMDARVSILQ